MKFYQNHCDKYYRSFPKIEAFFSADPKRITALKLFNKISTILVYAAYVSMLIYLAVKLDTRIIRVIAVPAAVFFIVTFIRLKINAPRPYEKYPIKPIIPKSTKGKSCPSRHSACAFIIAMAALYVSMPFGIAMLIIASLITASRPIMGVHFPLDVVFGASLAIIPGIIFFFVIP